MKDKITAVRLFYHIAHKNARTKQQNANRFTHVEQGLKKKGFANLLVCKALLLTPAFFRKIIQGRTDLEQQER